MTGTVRVSVDVSEKVYVYRLAVRGMPDQDSLEVYADA